MGRFIRHFCTLTVFIYSLPILAGGESSGKLEQLKTQGEIARLACNNKIHFDTYAFENCIDKLAKQSKSDDLSQLAINYAGFAIALSNMRMGMTGAEDTAAHFYKRYRPQQVKLNINDMDLCSSIPTDCKVRVAMTHEFAKTINNQKHSVRHYTVDTHKH